MVLGLVPVVSIIFTCECRLSPPPIHRSVRLTRLVTNQVGAALWAAALEKQNKGSPADALKDSSRQKDQDEVEVVMPAGGSGHEETRKEL